MKKKKEVLRACMGCGERKPKQELIRIVRTPDGNFVIDETGKSLPRKSKENPQGGTLFCADVSTGNL